MRLRLKQRRILPEKIQAYEKVKELFRAYKTVMLVDVEGVESTVFGRLKRMVRKLVNGEIEFASFKLSLVKRALRDAGIPGYENLASYLTGQRVFLASNENPFLLYQVVSAVRVPVEAKPGMKVDEEVVVPAGDTGISPGPIVSLFGRLRIPTKVQGGRIWVAKDTRVAKPGDVLSPELASLLQKLGISPAKKGLKVVAVYHDGIVIPAESLRLSVDEYKQMLVQAQAIAVRLGAAAVIPVPELLAYAVAQAYSRGIAVASEAGLLTSETASFVLAKAVQRALAVVAALGDRARDLGISLAAPAVTTAAQPSAPQPQPESKPKEEAVEEEKREISEEELAAGLSALFG